MNKDILNDLPVEGAPPTKEKTYNKKQGSGSKKKNQEKFRTRVNNQTEDKRLHDIDVKLGLISSDETGQLSSIISNVQITPSRRAIPITATSRGVGTTTAIFYSRAVTTWNLAAISEIATIHQVYRVHLWLFIYKLYLAQQIQSEDCNGNNVLQRLYIPDEQREIIASITEVPSLMSMILDSLGKVETNDATYHMGIPYEPVSAENVAEYRSLVITPANVRELLLLMANVETPLIMRRMIHQFWSIPGAYIGNDYVLMNSDSIYPAEYTTADLLGDVHAYKNLITRIQSRLPKHTFHPIVWSGKGTRSGLWSSSKLNIRVESIFENPRPHVGTAKRTRNATGDLNPVIPQGAALAVPKFADSRIFSERSEFWCTEKTEHAYTVIGAAAMVGEECFVHTRYELNAKHSITASSVLIQYCLSDAPR